MPTGVSQRGRLRTKPSAASHAAARAGSREHRRKHDLTVTIPLDRAMDVVTVPVAGVGRVLSARAELVRHATRGALLAVDLMAWPMAIAGGLGYAVLSRWGPLRQPPTVRRTPAAQSGPSARSTPAARPKSSVRSKPAAGSKSTARSKPTARPRSAARSRPVTAAGATRRG